MLAELKEINYSDNGVSVVIDFKTDKKGSDKFVDIVKNLVDKINEPVVISPNSMEVKNSVVIK